MTRALLVALFGIVLAVPAFPDLGMAQSGCPAEVDQAKEMLKQKTAAINPDDVQVPRSMAGARQDVQSPRGNQNVQSPRHNQDVQSPRGNQDVQSPRQNQDVQSPRGNQDVQSPRGNQNVQSPRQNQDVQSPRENQDVQSPRAGSGATASSHSPRSSNVTKAQSLVKEAEAACKAGNMTQASNKAKSAMALLK